MVKCRYSRMAIAAVLLNLIWITVLGLCIWIVRSDPGPSAGEFFLLPLMLGVMLGIPAGIRGIDAVISIRCSGGQFQGMWLAILGIVLTLFIPIVATVNTCIRISSVIS